MWADTHLIAFVGSVGSVGLAVGARRLGTVMDWR